MAALVDFQRRFAAALLSPAGLDPEFAAHPAIEIHAGTVRSGLTNALALSFPTIKKLTGASYFEQLVSEFMRQCPPRSAVLYEYGAELPQFLGSFTGAENYPYFCDVARFDWLVDRAGHCALDPVGSVREIPGYARVRLPASLTCARFDYAVDLIRDAVESERDAELRTVDVRPNPRWLVLWRSRAGASVKSVSAVAWRILKAAGYGAVSALDRTAEGYNASEALVALNHEIMPSSFVRLEPPRTQQR